MHAIYILFLTLAFYFLFIYCDILFSTAVSFFFYGLPHETSSFVLNTPRRETFLIMCESDVHMVGRICFWLHLSKVWDGLSVNAWFHEIIHAL